MTFQLTEVYMVITTDEDEGVPAFEVKGGLCPMFETGPDRRRFAILQELAQKLANSTGQTYKLATFTIREDFVEIVPKRQ